MNKLIPRKEAKSVIKKFPTNKSPGPDAFTGQFYETFKRVNTNTSQTIPKNRKGRKTQIPSMGLALITLIQKPDKESSIKSELQANNPDKDRHKNSQ